MTNVTAIIRDPSGNTYANALVIASFVGQNTTPGAGPYLGGGVPQGQFETVVPSETDSFGALAIPLLGNDIIQPSPSQWKFSVVSSTTPAVSFSVLITITGATQDISAALQAAAAPLIPNTNFSNVGTISLVEQAAFPSGAVNFDNIWANGSKTFPHRILANMNNTGPTPMAVWSDGLGVFASTTSAQLATIISDATGLGALMFARGAVFSPGKINGTFVVDGDHYTQDNAGLHSAVADATAQNGRVMIPDGVLINMTTPLVLGDNATHKSVSLELGMGSTLAVNITTGGSTAAFQLAGGSRIRGVSSLPNGGGGFCSQITFPATLNVFDLIAPQSLTGAQEGFILDNFGIAGNASATISNALIDITGLFTNTIISNLNTSSIPCKNLYIRGNTAGVSDVMVFNNNFDCSNAAGGVPLTVKRETGGVGAITFIGNDFQHAGNTLNLVVIDGNGTANGVSGLWFFGRGLETAGTPAADMVTIADAGDVHWYGATVSGTAVTSIFKISQTGAGRTNDIVIKGIGPHGNTNHVNNTIVGRTYSTAAFPNGLMGYKYSGFEIADNVVQYAQRYKASGTVLTAGDIVPSAGFGSTASVGSVLGTDQGFSFTITANGTGLAANPTVTITFKDGTWTNSPIALVSQGPGDSSASANQWRINGVTATTLTLQWIGTASGGQIIGASIICMGR